jgi:hypothetical protein
MVDLDRLAVQLGAAVVAPTQLVCQLFGAFSHFALIESCCVAHAPPTAQHDAPPAAQHDAIPTAHGAHSGCPTPQALLAHALGARWPLGAAEAVEATAQREWHGWHEWRAGLSLDARQRSAMLEEALHLLLLLSRHAPRPPGGAYERAALELSLLHALLLKRARQTGHAAQTLWMRGSTDAAIRLHIVFRDRCVLVVRLRCSCAPRSGASARALQPGSACAAASGR